MSNILAPIALFVYNRPWHTLQTLEALSINDLSDKSSLYIFCDGQKKNADDLEINNINEVRKLIKTKQWCERVEIIESKINKGLAKSIIEGVTELTNRFEKIIVLEDDIVTSKGFLKYMNEALFMYENNTEVMHISGYVYPVSRKLPETFFLNLTTCWGWATWKRAWKNFEKNPSKQIETLTKNNKWEEFTFNYSNLSFKNQIEDNFNLKLNTWAIFWYASVFSLNGLALHPNKSLVQNIGMDGTGENCLDSSENNPYNWKKLKEKIKVKAIDLKVSKKAFSLFCIYFNSLNKTNNNYSIRDNFYLIRKKMIKLIKRN